MTELSPEAKQLLREARTAFSPDDGRVEAVRAALSARLVADGTSASSGASAAQRMGVEIVRAAGWGVGHTAITAVVVAGALGAGALALRTQAARSTASSGHASAQHVAPNVTAAPMPSFDPALLDALETVDMRGANRASELALAPATAQPSKSRPRGPRPAAPHSELSPAQKATNPIADDSLAEEIRLLRGAREALDRGDASRALALLDGHEARFPAGTLREERLVTRVLALCQSGRPAAARAAAQQLERSAPRSPHWARIRSSCVGKDPTP